jgi:hypothetical protein
VGVEGVKVRPNGAFGVVHGLSVPRP